MEEQANYVVYLGKKGKSPQRNWEHTILASFTEIINCCNETNFRGLDIKALDQLSKMRRSFNERAVSRIWLADHREEILEEIPEIMYGLKTRVMETTFMPESRLMGSSDSSLDDDDDDSDDSLFDPVLSDNEESPTPSDTD